MEHFIKPATEEKQCSYVELVASGPQLAQWCLGLDWVVVDSWNQIIPGPLGANGPGAIDLHLLVAGGPVDEKEVPPRVQKKGTTFFF